MAIVQISRITQRKGLQENLPQLAGAEFGWSIDERRLFIGNGTLEEGAPVIGNTEILTEYSNITVLSDYTYEDIIVGYPAQTGVTASDPVVRTVQARLDDYVSVRAFGAVGDGQTDDTAAINRALFQLYCIAGNAAVRRALLFPAGTYRVTESIVIPAYAKLIGEGANCSIIVLDLDSTSDYVARYGDSLQQTGANIGNNGATPPRNIEISSMTFATQESTDVFLVEAASQCYFDSVDFIGPLTENNIIEDLSATDIAGVRFSSTAVAICNQITFDKCQYSGLTYGVNTDQLVESVTITNGKFNTLYQGVVLGTGTPVDGGPQGFRVQDSIFDQIFREGIVYDDVNTCISAHNIFFNVGNDFSTSPTSAIITLGNDNNVSVSDMFERTLDSVLIYPRVRITGAAATTGTLIQLGRYTRNSGRTFTLVNNQSTQPIFQISSALTKAFSMDYTIIRGAAVRYGTLTVTAQSYFNDEYTENFETGVTLSVSTSGAVVTVSYSTTNIGPAGTLTYSIANLA
jgi:polygalacturonase